MNPFYQEPTTINVGDTSPGAPGVVTKQDGGPTIVDNTYSQGNPFAVDAPKWQQGLHIASANASIARSTAAAQTAAQPDSFGTQVKDTIGALPGAVGDLASNAVHHPLMSASSILGGVLDVGPSTVNTMSSLGSGILNYIYGGAKNYEAKPIDLPLPGQTFNEYIGNNSPTSEGLQQAAKMVASYELGGGAARGLGLGGTTVDALGNTIPNATLASRVAGNVIGGQLVTDPKATLADRTKQAAFDAAFGIADTAARTVASSLKASAAAKAAVTDAKNTVMNTAIQNFEDASHPGHNPEVATKLRSFLSSKAYNNSKNMVDFETKLQGALGSDLDDPLVQKTLQPIIDAGHTQVANTIGITPPAKTPVAGKKVTPQDLMGDLQGVAEKLPPENTKPPEIKYIPKDDLGKDEYGNKRMAQTQVDNRTGNAIVYYDKSLDATPEARKVIFDHEQGHILDKQLNGGNNLSAELGNYQGNKSTLDAALGDFSKRNGMTVPEAAANLKQDMNVLSGKDVPANEQFADAVAEYRKDPAAAFKKAPTFSRLMNHVPQDGAISERSTSLESLKHDSPIAGKIVEEHLNESKKPVIVPLTEGEIGKSKNLITENTNEQTKGGDIMTGHFNKVTTGEDGKLISTPSSEQYYRQTSFAGVPDDILKQIKEGGGTRLSDADLKRLGDALTEHGYANKNTGLVVKGYGAGKDVVLGTTKLTNGQVEYIVAGIGRDGKLETVRLHGTPIDNSQIMGRMSPENFQKMIQGEKPIGKLEEAKIAPEPAAKAEGKAAKIAGTGLDTGKTVEGRLSFNPDKINAPGDVDKLFNKMEGENKSFSDARMSKSNEDIKDLSRLVGLKPEDLINAKPGSIANAETLTAARQLVLNKAQSFADRLKGIDLDNASNADLKGLRDDYAKLVAMQQTVAGLRSEAANTLRSLSIEIAPGEDFTLKQAFSELKTFGNKMGWDTSAFSEKVGKDMQLTTAQKVGKGIMNTWYASILSGPATPMRHGLSVISNTLTDIGSKAFNPKTMNEVVPSFKAFFESLGPAFEDAKNAFNETGPEAQAFRDTMESRAPIFTGKWATYGKVVEFVGRYMDAAATGYGRIAADVENASVKVNSPEMSEELQNALSKAYSDSTNYLGTPKGAVSRALQAGARAATNQAPILKFIVPFTNVVSNVLDRQFDYLPGTSFWRATESALSSQVDDIMKKFDLSSEADRSAIMGRLQAQQIGRAGMGVAVSISAMVAAKAGLISGSGPSDYNEKIELERTGWRPDSIKIGDMWVPYDYLGPLGGIFSMAGNIYDKTTYDKAPNKDILALINKGFIGWMQSNLNRSFLKGVGDLLGALTDQTKQQNYAKNFLSELVPIPKAVTGTRAIISAALGQEYQYQTHGVIDKLRANLGLTGSVLGMPALEPRRNAFGEPLRSDIIYGITPSIGKADVVDSFLQANDIVITIPAKSQQYTDQTTGQKRALTDTEYDAYLKTSGKLIYQNLQGMIPELQGLDVDTQRAEIRSMLDNVRTEARAEVMISPKK